MIDISTLKNKVEDHGATSAGRLQANEWNTLVDAVEELQDESYVKPDTGIPTTDITDASKSMTQAEINQGVDEALAGKQATLVSGTNIKTVGGVSILGSGDIPIQSGGSDADSVKYVQQSLSADQKAQARTNIGAQEVLVSGSTIKTVNGQSALGTGDIEINGIDAISSQQDGSLLIALSSGDTVTVDLNHFHSQYPKYVYCPTQYDYDDIVSKESDTMYLIYGSSQSSSNIVYCASEAEYNAISPKSSNTLYVIAESE